MRIAQINAVPYGSTGNIMFSLAELVRLQGGESLCTTGFTWKKPAHESFFLTSGLVEKFTHQRLAMLTGNSGSFSHPGTAKLLKRLDNFSPDVVHLHNLHGWFVNLPMLFSYLKDNRVNVVWTLHDCWAFTGHCPHYTMCGCDRWKTGCHSCPQHRLYPASYVDDSRHLWERKRRWFTGVDNLTVVTPSAWMGKQVQASFLQDYPTEMIHNGIDLSVFSPKNGEFREKYALEKKFVVLGVSYEWTEKKGFDVFQALASRLDERYQLVLVGTDEATEKKLPSNVISIRRTQNREELAALYTMADVFLNPSREENYPTVNLESIACGTPVVAFRTGGAPETIPAGCGTVVDRDDVDALLHEVQRICEERPFSRAHCVECGKRFDKNLCFQSYLDLYQEIYESTARNGI